jgi:hypothetical protein
VTISVMCFILKVLMQVVVIVPFVAILAFTIRNYVMAYFHLVFIGMVSLFILAWAIEHRILSVARIVQIGLYALVTGFIIVEFALFIQGTMLWMGEGFLSFYYPLMFIASVLLPIGLLIITIRNLKYLPIGKEL